jgi:hypothetical protein
LPTDDPATLEEFRRDFRLERRKESGVIHRCAMVRDQWR